MPGYIATVQCCCSADVYYFHLALILLSFLKCFSNLTDHHLLNSFLDSVPHRYIDTHTYTPHTHNRHTYMHTDTLRHRMDGPSQYIIIRAAHSCSVQQTVRHGGHTYARLFHHRYIFMVFSQPSVWVGGLRSTSSTSRSVSTVHLCLHNYTDSHQKLVYTQKNRKEFMVHFTCYTCHIAGNFYGVPNFVILGGPVRIKRLNAHKKFATLVSFSMHGSLIRPFQINFVFLRQTKFVLAPGWPAKKKR